MGDQQEVFQLMGEVSRSIFPLAQAVMGPLFEQYFTEQRFYMPTFMAANIAPKQITAEILSKRTPYANPETFMKTLTDTAEAGYLDYTEADNYIVSEKGKKAIKDVHEAFYGHINSVNQFPADKIANLVELLENIIKSCGKAEFVTGTIAFDISHGGHPDVEPDSLAEVDQHLDDLNAFRDDAHIAAWTPSGVNGQLWEALSFVWNGEANTAEKLIERLPFRNYTEKDYKNALGDLQELGWIEKGDEGFIVTTEGKKIREDGESLTNSNYFMPWSVLSNAELKGLEKLLAELKEANEKIT